VDKDGKRTMATHLKGNGSPSDISILHTTTILSSWSRTIRAMTKLLVLFMAVLTACTAQPGVTVLRVTDGDTLVVRQGGDEIKVRLIGINAPERDECYGSEATAALRQMVDGRPVSIVTDEETFDQFGRLLAYVYVDGDFTNQSLVENGFALAQPYPPNTIHQTDFEQAMLRAKEAHTGMWNPSACGQAAQDIIDIGDIAFNPPGPDEQSLNQETVTLTNSQSSVVDLTGWILRDGSSTHRFVFPDGFVLGSGASVTVHTGCGSDSAEDLHWCAEGPIWNNAGDVAILFDDSGALVSSVTYPRP